MNHAREGIKPEKTIHYQTRRVGSLEFDIEHVAKLANLPLDEKHLEILGKQLTETLLYIDKLNEIPTEKVERTSQVTGLTNVTRDDTVSASLPQEAAVENAPATHNGYIVVDAILEEEQ
jgi:aspartyl-tRNA(Asn)/glutamyl-tRNA(Gln) amidotransferase subunit C